MPHPSFFELRKNAKNAKGSIAIFRAFRVFRSYSISQIPGQVISEPFLRPPLWVGRQSDPLLAPGESKESEGRPKTGSGYPPWRPAPPRIMNLKRAFVRK
jgi:hypothetical protein